MKKQPSLSRLNAHGGQVCFFFGDEKKKEEEETNSLNSS